MAAITFHQRGNFTKTWRFLERCKETVKRGILDKYGRAGVQALREATPKDTGLTATSWDYRIVHGKDYVSLEWTNTNIVDGIPVAVLLQYGHGTANGSYVQGIDYINPALKPIFDAIARDVWKEVNQ